MNSRNVLQDTAGVLTAARVSLQSQNSAIGIAASSISTFGSQYGSSFLYKQRQYQRETGGSKARTASASTALAERQNSMHAPAHCLAGTFAPWAQHQGSLTSDIANQHQWHPVASPCPLQAACSPITHDHIMIT